MRRYILDLISFIHLANLGNERSEGLWRLDFTLLHPKDEVNCKLFLGLGEVELGIQALDDYHSFFFSSFFRSHMDEPAVICT